MFEAHSQWVERRGLYCDGNDGEQDGITPTYIAAQMGHVKCIDVLVRHGADVNKATRVSAWAFHGGAEARLSGELFVWWCM